MREVIIAVRPGKLNQVIELGGKRHARVSVAESGVLQAAKMDFTIMLNEIRATVTTRFTTLTFAQSASDLHAPHWNRTQRAIAAKSKVAVGKVAPLEEKPVLRSPVRN